MALSDVGGSHSDSGDGSTGALAVSDRPFPRSGVTPEQVITMVEKADPETAFAALSDATRVDILRALWDADDDALTFSELRDAVGVRDSGQFNYHLDKLRGLFVAKTKEGYELTLAGKRVNGSIHGGVFDRNAGIEPIPLDRPCPACGGERTLRYEDETVRVECADCSLCADLDVPPGVFEGYDRSEIPALATRYFRTTIQQLRNGFCRYCEGRVEPTVVGIDPGVAADDERAIADPADAPTGDFPLVRYECTRCGAGATVDLGIAVLDEPAVVAFYHDHGTDVQEAWWELVAWGEERARISGRDPFRATVTYPAGDDRLTVVVDEACAVVSVE